MEVAAATSWLDSEPPCSGARCRSDLQAPVSERGGAAESRAGLSGRASPCRREAARGCTSRNPPGPSLPWKAHRGNVSAELALKRVSFPGQTRFVGAPW